MKKFFGLMFLAVLALSLSWVGFSWAQNVATAQITNSCVPQNGTLVVPAGKTASGFRVEGLGNGYKCRGAGSPDSRGWGIKTASGSRVYSWSRFKSKKPYESGGPLSSLRLAAGTYYVYVDGGKGALVKIAYTLR